MLSNRLAFAALAVACLAAAAGGGYLAVRQTAAPQPLSAHSAAGEPAASPVGAATAPSQPEAAPDPAGAPAASAPTSEPAAAPSEPAAHASARAAAPRTARSDARETGTASRPRQAARASDAAAQPPAAVVPDAPLPADASVRSDAPAEPVQAPAPIDQPPTFAELVVAADSVIGLQTETPVSTETARVEDRVNARVTRDVRVDGRVAIPAGSRAIGSVTVVERGGKFKERSRLGVRFHTLLLADGTRLPISTDTIYREGEAPGGDASKKIGGAAVGGAILGAILGGARGAAIGATAGAGAGTAVVAAGDRSAATLPAGTPMTVRLLSPVTVSVEEK